MKIAYLIAAHRNGRQLNRLLRAIDDSENVYVIHVDRRAERAVHDATRAFAQGRRNVHVMSPRKIIWGGESLLRVQLAAMDVALRADASWQQFVILSGQCYPLLPQAVISRALDAGGVGRNYVEVHDYAKSSPAIRPRTRYWHVEFNGNLLRVPFFRRPAPGLKLHWGSNFVMLSRGFCDYLFHDPLAARCQDYFTYIKIPDEFFFQTVLMNSPFRDTHVRDHKRLIIWDGGSPHPRTLTRAELPALLASSAFFARKFDEAVDTTVLDAIDRERLTPRAEVG